MPWWESSAFWGVAGFLISFICLLVGKERILMKHHITTRLVTPEEIVYMSKIGFLSNNQLKNINKTTIKFTNSGNRTIEPSDYATKEPLGVHISGRLYQHHASADNNNSLPTITPVEDNKYKIEFDFLKPKQSFSITLFHDGIANVFGELRSGRSIGIIGGIIRNIGMNIPENIMYCMNGQRRPSLFSSLISRIISLLLFAIFIITVHFVFTVKPLLFAVFGVIVGILTGEILFGIRDFLMNFYNKFNHKGGGV